MNGKQHNVAPLWAVACDVVLINLSLVLAYVLRYRLQWFVDVAFDAPAWQWQPGDRFVQLAQLMLPASLAADAASLRLGFYRRADLQRLPITNGDGGETDYIVIPLTTSANNP